MWKTKVTSKGRITIPQEIRCRMGLSPGDTLEIKETDCGYVIDKAADPEELKKYIGCVDLQNMTSDAIVKDLRGGDLQW